MQSEHTLELEDAGVGRLMTQLSQRHLAYRQFSRRPRGGGYQARVLLDSMHNMMRALQLAVPFRTGSHQLETYLVAQLHTLADSLREMPELRVIVEGHTDVRGARRFNRKLALHRAQAVRSVLVGANVAPERVTARAFGVEGANHPNGDRGGYPLDRKVIIMFDIEEDDPCIDEDL